jgi:predicted transcriptional regulator
MVFTRVPGIFVFLLISSYNLVRRFITTDRYDHAQPKSVRFSTRSDPEIYRALQVIEEALSLLRERELETAYRESSLEIDEAWDVVIADGLADETW